ncbi:MAG: hypothetical protein HY052_08275, partial [Proteobacteria bacterium]|nr:hypothetical protein [Pseudomonadota bacterium]
TLPVSIPPATPPKKEEAATPFSWESLIGTAAPTNPASPPPAKTVPPPVEERKAAKGGAVSWADVIGVEAPPKKDSGDAG